MSSMRYMVGGVRYVQWYALAPYTLLLYTVFPDHWAVKSREFLG